MRAIIPTNDSLRIWMWRTSEIYMPDETKEIPNIEEAYPY